MDNDIDKTSPHYKGEFGSIYEVNQKFPSGGVEGDYVAIDGWAHYWNADRGTWCVNAQRDSYWDELITGIIEKFKLFKGATYMGVAGLDTVPAKAIGAKMYYFATVAGTYKNFGGLVVPQGINVLYSEDGSSWVCSTLLEVAQELGVSTRNVVSQKVVNEALAKKADKETVDVELGKKANTADVDTKFTEEKKRVDAELGKKFDKESIAQEAGDSEELVMSQKAVSTELSNLQVSIFVDNISDKSNFVKEVYLIGGDISKTYYISNISRNKKGYWWVEIKEKETGNRLGFTSKTEESPIITNTDSSNIKYYLFVNWNAIDVDTQVSVDIVLNNKAFDINNSPTIQGVLYSKYANDKLNDKLGDAIDISQYLIQQVYLKSNGETINGSWNVWYKIPVEKGDIITAKGITPDNISVSLASAVLYDSEGAPYLFTNARNAFEQEPIRKAGFVSIMANPEYQYDIKIVKNNSAGIATNVKIIENNNYIENIIPIASSYKDCILGYIDTNSTDGTSSLVVGNTVKVRVSNSFKLIKTKVIKGDVIYVPYVDYNKFSNAYPIIVDLCNTILYVYNTKGMETFNYKGVKYLKLKVAMSGYLIVSSNTEIIIYSENASLRNLEKEELSDNEKSVIRKYLGIEALAPIIPDIPLNYYDYEVACKMNPILLRNIIEMSSNGSCTVIYDNHKYPSLMYKIPLMSIGQLDSRLGDDNTPHPAFVVNGVIKKHIYAGVFMNTVYNDVPISWFGNRPLLTSKSFLESRNLCKGKGTGWHLETIWERSLISFLTALNHNTDKPTCNNDHGRSLVKHEQCVESRSTDNYLPGKFPNGGQWINGSQPIEWSHNNSRWGIFDIIGAFHEWCNLAKSDNGHIYLCEDNSYDKEESNWLDTGAYITSENNEIVYDTELKDIVTEHQMQSWASIKCNKSYDSISEDIRKKMALALMCPRLASTDEKSLHDFNGRIWIRSNLVCYPFIGGALEYNDSGLGFNILSYDGNEAHNNMGSRLFYIE